MKKYDIEDIDYIKDDVYTIDRKIKNNLNYSIQDYLDQNIDSKSAKDDLYISDVLGHLEEDEPYGIMNETNTKQLYAMASYLDVEEGYSLSDLVENGYWDPDSQSFSPLIFNRVMDLYISENRDEMIDKQFIDSKDPEYLDERAATVNSDETLEMLKDAKQPKANKVYDITKAVAEHEPAND